MSSSDAIELASIAKLFCVTEKAVRGWIKRGMPVERAGRRGGASTLISLRAAVAWYFAENDERLNLNREKARLTKHQADKAEMEMAIRCGELSVTAEISDWYANHVRRCKARLLQLPDAIGQFCADRQSAAIVVAEVRRLTYEAMTELARHTPPAVAGATEHKP